MENDKIRTSLTLPAPLYELLHADSIKYGIAKSTIVSTLLLNYYREKQYTSGSANEAVSAMK